MPDYRSFALATLAAVLATVWLAGPLEAHDGAHKSPPQAAMNPAAGYAFALPEPGSYRLPPIRAAAGGSVLAADGTRIDLARLLRGRITVFSFIYTRCTDICPIATMQLAQLREVARHNPTVRNQMQLVSMSFDPAHDTAAVMAEYGGHWRAAGDGGAEWHFLTAPDEAALRPILDAYGQAVARNPDPDDPTGGLNHILRVFLIDKAGIVRNIYSMDFLDPELVLNDITTLVYEETGLGQPATGAQGPSTASTTLPASSSPAPK